MCPPSLEIDISSSFFLHFWQGDSRKSQDLAWVACSVPRNSDQGATNSEFCWMQGPGIECGLSIGFDAFLLSFLTNRMLLFTVSLCLCPPGQNSGISNISSQTLLFTMAKQLRDPAQSTACKHLPIPPPLPRLRCSDLSVGQPAKRGWKCERASRRLRLRPSRQEVSILGSPVVPNLCVERRSFRGRRLAWSFVHRHVFCCNDLVSSQ